MSPLPKVYVPRGPGDMEIATVDAACQGDVASISPGPFSNGVAQELPEHSVQSAMVTHSPHDLTLTHRTFIQVLRCLAVPSGPLHVIRIAIVVIMHSPVLAIMLTILTVMHPNFIHVLNVPAVLSMAALGNPPALTIMNGRDTLTLVLAAHALHVRNIMHILNVPAVLSMATHGHPPVLAILSDKDTCTLTMVAHALHFRSGPLTIATRAQTTVIATM